MTAHRVGVCSIMAFSLWLYGMYHFLVKPMMSSKDVCCWQAFLPLLKKAASAAAADSHLSCSRAAIVNISTKVASIDDNKSGGGYAYRASKVPYQLYTRECRLLPGPDCYRMTSLAVLKCVQFTLCRKWRLSRPLWKGRGCSSGKQINGHCIVLLNFFSLCIFMVPKRMTSKI